MSITSATAPWVAASSMSWLIDASSLGTLRASTSSPGDVTAQA